MGTLLRPITHDDRLSLVEHLTELRTRLIVCLVVFLAVFGVCFWQNHAILDLVNRPLERAQKHHNGPSGDPFESAQYYNEVQRREFREVQRNADALERALRGAADVPPAAADSAAQISRSFERLRAATPPASTRKPVTLGVTEPFTQTFKVAAYAALLIALPLLLFQLYAFVLPAFAPREREVALPLMAAVPVLFYGGVTFAFLVVLPNALTFLQNFNDSSYDILLQAKDYYRFAILVMAVLGLLFQLPVAIVAVTRLGIVTPRQLRANRRYSILVIAILAMLLPGTDPVTMLLSMAPLLVLFEASILFASLLDRRAQRREERDAEPS